MGDWWTLSEKKDGGKCCALKSISGSMRIQSLPPLESAMYPSRLMATDKRTRLKDFPHGLPNAGLGGVPGHCVSITQVSLSRPPHGGLWSVRPPVDRCE